LLTAVRWCWLRSACSPGGPAAAQAGQAPRAEATAAAEASPETWIARERGGRRCPGRAAGPGRAVQPGDRRPAVHQPAHRQVPPQQRVHQARHQLPRPAAPGPARRPRHRSAALTPGQSAGLASKLPGRPWPVDCPPGRGERRPPQMTLAGTQSPHQDDRRGSDTPGTKDTKSWQHGRFSISAVVERSGSAAAQPACAGAAGRRGGSGKEREMSLL
jgi:hypothetical protein